MCLKAVGLLQWPGFLAEQQICAQATGEGPKSCLDHFQNMGGDSQNKACLFPALLTDSVFRAGPLAPTPLPRARFPKPPLLPACSSPSPSLPLFSLPFSVLLTHTIF